MQCVFLSAVRLLCIRLSKTDPSPQNFTAISNITRAQQVVGGEGSKNQRTWWCLSKRKAVLEEEQDFDNITKTKNHSKCNQECNKKVNRVRFDLMLTWKYIHAKCKVQTLPLCLFFGHLWSELTMRRSRVHHGRLTPPPTHPQLSIHLCSGGCSSSDSFVNGNYSNPSGVVAHGTSFTSLLGL